MTDDARRRSLTYEFTADYKADMHRHIDGLFTAAKTLDTSRSERLQASGALVDQYVEHAEERPEGTALDRLSTLILRDELTDDHPDKMTREEYPLLSGRQRARRSDDEVSSVWADEVGIDGRDYRQSTRDGNRKMREVNGSTLRDADVHARNKLRRKDYREFTKVQPVYTYFIDV